MDEDVLLVSVMAANSETGTLAPLSDVVAVLGSLNIIAAELDR